MKKRTLGFTLVVLLLLLACSSLQLDTPRATALPTKSFTPSVSNTSTASNFSTKQPSFMTSTPVVKLENKDVFCPSENQEAREAYNKAMSLTENGKFAEAEKLYLKAIELDPKFCDAMDNLGQLLRKQNKIDEAIQWYNKSLEIKADNTVALQNIALAYHLQGETEKAIEKYKQLIDVSPENPEGYFGLGNIYFGLEQPEKAISYFETAEKLYAQSASPYLPDAQYYLGFSYFMVEDCATAKKYLEPIYTQFSEDGGMNYILGVCYLTTEPKNEKLARDYILKAQQLGINIPADILNAINDN